MARSKKKSGKLKAKSAAELSLIDEVGRMLNALPDVFSTVQWGGRAYKVALAANRAKFKLLAHVSAPETGRGVNVEFKLPPAEARQAIDRFAWVRPHGFRTLAPAGWVHASITQRRQVSALKRLLDSSRAQFPSLSSEVEPSTTEAVARQTGSLDRTLRLLRADGWRPRADD